MDELVRELTLDGTVRSKYRVLCRCIRPIWCLISMLIVLCLYLLLCAPGSPAERVSVAGLQWERHR